MRGNMDSRLRLWIGEGLDARYIQMSPVRDSEGRRIWKQLIAPVVIGGEHLTLVADRVPARTKAGTTVGVGGQRYLLSVGPTRLKPVRPGGCRG